MRSRLAEALARLEATEVEVEEWAASQREASAAEAVAYKRRTEAQRGEMEAAIAVHAERRDELDALTQSIADLETSSENVRTENATIAHVTDAKLDADAVRRRDGARAKCMAAEEDLNAAARSSELEMEEQSRSIAFYRRLGLRFDCLEGEQLKLTFTQIDAAEPTREFIIAVSVDDGDVYRVMQCAPEVELLDALVTELNATNNFSLFVQALRRSFVALAAAQVEEE